MTSPERILPLSTLYSREIETVESLSHIKRYSTIILYLLSPKAKEEAPLLGYIVSHVILKMKTIRTESSVSGKGVRATASWLLLLVCVFSQIRTSLAFSASMPVDAAQAAAMENTVRAYFDGVNKQDPEQIMSCFAPKVTIRDVCGINKSKREATAQDMAQRCMEFLAAHPDTKVDFHYGPECGRYSRWVVAHWWETGTWSGASCGIEPKNQPMAVEGQTRFYVNEELMIVDMVVTRTFTEWEDEMLKLRASQEAQKS